MRDPLVLDAFLVFFGGVFVVFFWAAIHSNGEPLSTPVAVAGGTGTLALAALVKRYYARLSAIGRRVAGPADTLRERARFALSIVAVVLARIFLFPLLPDSAFHAIFGIAVAMVALGLGRGIWRWRVAGSNSGH